MKQQQQQPVDLQPHKSHSNTTSPKSKSGVELGWRPGQKVATLLLGTGSPPSSCRGLGAGGWEVGAGGEGVEPARRECEARNER